MKFKKNRIKERLIKKFILKLGIHKTRKSKGISRIGLLTQFPGLFTLSRVFVVALH